MIIPSGPCLKHPETSWVYGQTKNTQSHGMGQAPVTGRNGLVYWEWGNDPINIYGLG